MTRNKGFMLRLSENELNRLDRCVRKTTMSREAYVRSLVFGYEPQARPPEEYYDLISDLRTVDNELRKYASSMLASNTQAKALLTALSKQLTKICDRLQCIFLPRKRE